MVTFTASNALAFYVFFELSLIPIFMLVLGWGYQPERLVARINLLFYTISRSMPLLIVLCLRALWSSQHEFLAQSGFMSSVDIGVGAIFSLIIIIRILVKFPIFGVHLWLPKAHVEAPVEGSIFLAAIILKLAGYGIIRLSPLVHRLPLITFIQRWAMIGAVIVSLTCLRQTDIKVIIAYSSVAHMAIAIAAILSETRSGLMRAMWIIIAHGVSSSFMFFGANIFYSQFHTRNLTLIKGALTFIPSVCTLWFIACVANFGGPPTINLAAEIVSIISIMAIRGIFLTPIFLVTFIAAAYSLIIYASPTQGKCPRGSSVTFGGEVRVYLNIYAHMIYLLIIFLWMIYFYIKNNNLRYFTFGGRNSCRGLSVK